MAKLGQYCSLLYRKSALYHGRACRIHPYDSWQRVRGENITEGPKCMLLHTTEERIICTLTHALIAIQMYVQPHMHFCIDVIYKYPFLYRTISQGRYWIYIRTTTETVLQCILWDHQPFICRVLSTWKMSPSVVGDAWNETDVQKAFFIFDVLIY